MLALGSWAWHRSVVPRRSALDEEAVRLRFLEAIREHGRFELAATSISLTPNAVRSWIINNPEEGKEFKAAWDLAKILHAQDIVRQLEHEAIHGHEEPVFDKDGKRVGTKMKYETTLRAMVMRRYDSDYREKTEVTHKSETGVMVVPHPVGSVAAWAELVQSAKDAAEQRTKEATEKGTES